MRPEALRYFLPLYLEHAIRHPDSDVFEFVIYHLGPNPSETDSDDNPERIGFSTDQRRVVCDFLRWARSVVKDDSMDDEIERGLVRWSVAA